MKKPDIYITRMIPETGINRLKKTCNVEINPHDRPLTKQELHENCKGKDGVIGLLTDRIDGAFFDAAYGIKGYANYAVGYDNIDLDEAVRRKIPVSNTPDVLTHATAEMAWTLLFAVARRIIESERLMRAGLWKGWGPLQFIGGDVTGKTLGIVGTGRIGTAMAMKSKGFDMDLVYYSRSENKLLEKALYAKRVGFTKLLETADFISIHVPLLPETYHLFDAEAFRRMKPTAYLINTARGPVISEADLVQALSNKQIAGAALDVYENEPHMAKGLAQLDNVVIVPHTGSATVSSRTGMALLAADNLLAMLSGKPGPSCLNPEVF